MRSVLIRLLTVGLAACLVLPAAAEVGGAAPPAPPPTVSWWSAGDSYAAGEGVPGAQGYCQQSLAAFGPKATLILSQQQGWTVPTQAFTACTGHTVVDEDMSKKAQREQNVRPACKAPDSLIETRPTGNQPDDEQSLVSWGKTQPGWTSDDRFDVVTMSFGGNDICFADIVTDCLGVMSDEKGFIDSAASYTSLVATMDPVGRCGVTEAAFKDRIDALFDRADTSNLPALWQRTVDEHLTERGVLIVAGYPRLITPSKQWQGWRGDRCNTIHRDDADTLGRMAGYLDQRMRQAAATADAGRGRIRYVSRFDLFDDNGNSHSLCSSGVEWLNTVFLFLRDGTLRKERGFHPNELGHTATAEAVAGTAVAWWSGQAAAVTAQAPTSATAPEATPAPVESGDQDYEPGSRFSARCTVAWPTAPSRSATSITMRTFCPGVPDQFLFVDIAYPDPDLDVTPNRPTMDVEGVVDSISHSDLGFTVLVVIADDITVLDN